jgi:hypothetical protein
MLLLCSAADGGIGVPVDVGEGGMKISMMTKNLRYGYRVFCLTIIVYVITLGPVVAAENLSAPSTTPPMLEVGYDHKTDLFSILARQTPLDKVLQEISKRAHLTIDSPNQELLREPISVEIKWLSLEQALKKLLEGFNAAFVYTAGSETREDTTTPRLAKIKIFIFSRKASMSPEALEELAQKEEKGKTVEAILASLNDKDPRARHDTIAALKDLAPEQAVSALANWLPEIDQKKRVVAAIGLGSIGGEQAIDVLSSALRESEPLTRQFVANSLAQIGGERAMATLFDAYRDGDSGLGRAVATAIVSYGDERSQAALARLITGGTVPRDGTAQDVIADSLHREAGYDSRKRAENPHPR